jgi:hypothetical protein
MFIYKKIYIESQIQKEIENELATLNLDIYKEVFNYIDIDEIKKECPMLFRWILDKKLNPIKIAIIITYAGLYDTIPHVDAQINSLALNFPISNCEESDTIFYKTNTPLDIEILTKPNGVIYKSIKNKDWIELDRYTLDRATLINTHVPHKIINRGKNKRIALSIRFDPDPWELIT